mmetsp:Transcript_18477/g.17788  ORF Transcript_18477/g.17788 Transcript_18477/m.17788 type:complete len:136 (+) Transcript_18477:141-548(+)
MSSDAFYVGIVVALVFVLISILYWFSTVNGSKAYSNSQLSELYKSLLGDGMGDDKLSGLDENLSLTEIIERFQTNQDNETYSDSQPSVSSSILRLLSKRLRNNAHERIEAAEMNLHSNALDFIQKSLPIGNHQDM